MPSSSDKEIVFVASHTDKTIKLTEDTLWSDIRTVDDAQKMGAAMAAILIASTAGRVLHHITVEKTHDGCTDEAIATLERIYAQAFLDNQLGHIAINGKSVNEILNPAPSQKNSRR